MFLVGHTYLTIDCPWRYTLAPWGRPRGSALAVGACPIFEHGPSQKWVPEFQAPVLRVVQNRVVSSPNWIESEANYQNSRECCRQNINGQAQNCDYVSHSLLSKGIGNKLVQSGAVAIIQSEAFNDNLQSSAGAFTSYRVDLS